MSEHHLQIDVLMSKYERRRDDLIKIRLERNDVIEVSFSKLVGQSKYIRDKYKYSEAFEMMQNEIDEILKHKKVDSESIKLFFQLLEEGKVSLPLEHYQCLYILSETFDIPLFITELDNIFQEKLLQDLNFTIQQLQDLIKTNDMEETKLTSKIEIFLSTRINECITNTKFKELPVATISRIIEKSDKEEIDHNLLVDFIVKSIDKYYIFLRFIELEKVLDDKIDDFFKFIDSQKEDQKKMCLEYLPFSLSFFKKLKNKYDKILKEFNEIKEKEVEQEKTKEELKQSKEEQEKTKEELKQTKEEQEKTKEELKQTKEKLKQSKEEQEKVKEELQQTKEEQEKTKEEFKKAKEEQEKTKEELKQSKEELKQSKEVLEQSKKEQEKTKEELKQIKEQIKLKMKMKPLMPATVTTGGNDQYYQLGQKPNDTKSQNINPSLTFQLDPSPLLSYSAFLFHSVLITSDGLIKGIGYNNDGRISSTLQNSVIDHFTEFCIKDSNDHKLNPVSAVCYGSGTLYMFSKTNGCGNQLVLCDCKINKGVPIFLDIGNHQPVALFGGDSQTVSICSEGEIIFINSDSVKKSPQSRIEAVSLPDNEKASCVACNIKSIIVLSSNGRVFSSPIEEESSVLRFSEVVELSDKKIVSVSGTIYHVFAISKEGHVFGRGSNENGQLGLGKDIKESSSFTEITSLKDYEIIGAYAGGYHSLFLTREGKMLSCGYNLDGRLLLSSEPCEKVFSPTETTNIKGATFCVAGCYGSTVFIGIDPPQNTPNKRIEKYD